ncbi:MAG: FAD-dependent oxidoreductase, partial [Chloroflexi bacterium]|nr:FAD-dependent oxidoreductase [Chloroflexota bacterium]
LALLLARRDIPVTLLEEHQDFERDFRGDTIHPSTMELMDQLGLADRLLELPHTKLHTFGLQTPQGSVTIADLRRLKTRFPYITFMPQARFLEFITAEARREPSFRLVMGAGVQGLVVENGVVRGVRYRGRDGWHEIRAPLTVGADGRFSRVRRLAGFEPIGTAPPMDVLWFRLPRRPDEPHGAVGRIANGHFMAMLDRGEQWQIAYAIPKGSYRELREAGITALRSSVAGVAPELADRVAQLEDWKDVSLLSVESSRVPRWYRPGLLLIGDAAHVMSPVGGVGINYAIQDAVVAANVLSGPLLSGRLHLRDMAEVQRQRAWPTRVIQAIQGFLQRRVVATALDPNATFAPPAFLRLPLLRDLPARLIAFGVRPVRLEQ